MDLRLIAYDILTELGITDVTISSVAHIMMISIHIEKIR